MPRPEQPPTPASSTEIRGKDGAHFSTLQMSFELPPPAVATAHSRSPSTSKTSSASSYQPASPKSPAIPASEVVKIRRRSSVAQAPAKDAFALPPPPTKSRKIIQMKPRGQQDESLVTLGEGPKNGLGKGTPSTLPKKKQPSSTSVAGRKIARKTAHSIIERRRRSKMNEEFGVLKDMIPACTGEMHKLAILQASIDYVRYLEDCVATLKAENNRKNSTPRNEQFMLPPAARGSVSSSRRYESYDDDEDTEMAGSEATSPKTITTPILYPNRVSVSPALLPQMANQRHNSFSHSTSASPNIHPNVYDYTQSTPSSALTSPALLPQRDLDQEATAALLMLNTDRRGTNSNSGRGMSVKDLLSA